MNLEIASRLAELRKENNYSQEALAEKLGISRQAVSKWERAEASPDTDNLILLAKLYNISLDELLLHNTENDKSDNSNNSSAEANTDEDKQKDYVHIGLDGIHIIDAEDQVHVSWNGIHVVDSEDEVHIDKNGIFINDEKYNTRKKVIELINAPISLLIIIAYFVISVSYNAWHPAWLIFFLIPILTSLTTAIVNKKPSAFAYPVLATLIFLSMGILYGAWAYSWLVFLTIPLYYSICSYFKKLRNLRKSTISINAEINTDSDN